MTMESTRVIIGTDKATTTGKTTGIRKTIITKTETTTEGPGTMGNN